MLWPKSKQVNESHGVGGVSTGSDQQGARFFGQSAVAVRETTQLLFGLQSPDHSGRASLNIRASYGSRSTARRTNVHNIPASNPSRLRIHSRHIARRHASHRGGFDLTTTLRIRLCNSRVDFQIAYSCSISAHARSQPCHPGAGLATRAADMTVPTLFKVNSIGKDRNKL